MAASTVNDLSGGFVRVAAAGSGFTVRFPTGRTTVAATLATVWAEVLRHASRSLPEPQPDLEPSSSWCDVAPEIPTGRLAVAVTEHPERTAFRLARRSPWTVMPWEPTTSPEAVAAALSTNPALLLVAPEHLEPCLHQVTGPYVRVRATVTALVHDGAGPSFATDVRGLDGDELLAVLEGASGPARRHHDLPLPRAVAWLAGLMHSGATRGRRVTWLVADGRWAVDVADGHGLAIRPVAG